MADSLANIQGNSQFLIVIELWEQALLPYNLPLTVLLGAVVVFWLLSILGVMDIDAFDFDFDADVEGDVSGVPAAMMRVVNAGLVPLTIVLSVLVLLMWMASMVLNFYFNPGQSWLLAIGFFFASFFIGVIGTKILTQPLVPLMKRLKEGEDIAPVIGQIGVVRSIEMDSTYGQVEVEREDGAPAILNAKLGEDSPAIPRGTQVAILSMDEKTGVYFARALPSAPEIS
ncbi:MAG: hypothetical protein ACSHX7_11670 [Luteolibacter sp.]